MVRDVPDRPAVAASSMHVDFLRGRPERGGPRDGSAGAHRQGRSASTNGGNLHQSMHIVPVAAKPAAIPTKLEVDVIGAGHRRRAPRQRPEAGRGRPRRCSTPRRRIASVVAPKAEKVEEVAAAPVEGAVPAEGAAAGAAAARRRRAGAAAAAGGTAARRAEAARSEAETDRHEVAARNRQEASRCTSWSGSGIPGEQYADNRHNVGFMVVDELRAPGPGRRAAREVRRGDRGGDDRGQARPAVQAHGVHERQRPGGGARRRRSGRSAVGETVVVHDELDLPFDRLKLGAGGGRRSQRRAIADLGARRPGLRAGARRHRPPGPGPRRGRLGALGLLARRGGRCCPSWSDAAADAVEAIVSDGLTTAMNRFNGSERSKQDTRAGYVIDTAPSSLPLLVRGDTGQTPRGRLHEHHRNRTPARERDAAGADRRAPSSSASDRPATWRAASASTRPSTSCAPTAPTTASPR